jgi:RimJ/RimL family protein N-acetyltransferase
MRSELDKKPFPHFLTGPRIFLALASPAYTSQVWDYIQLDHQLGGKNYSWIDGKQEVETYITHEPEPNAREFTYLILKSKRVIGTFHVHTISYLDHKAEIGYALQKGKEGFGYVSEALQLIEAEMKKLGFNKLIISCNSKNERSIQVAKRNGFHQEGLLLQDCIENGEFRDSMVFGKLLNG